MGSQPARAAIRDVLFRRYLPLVNRAAVEDKAVEVLGLNYAYSMDTFVQWQFGRSLASNFIEDQQERKMYLDGWFAPSGFTFWQYEFPDFARLLRRIGIYLIPDWVDVKFKAIEDWNLEKCDKAQQLLASGEILSPEDQPVVFEQALRSMSEVKSEPNSYPFRLEIASDMFTHNSAAFETSGNTESYLFYEMCRNPTWQKRLHDEVNALSPDLVYDLQKQYRIEDLPEPKDVEALPILHAVIAETLRLYPAVPGGQPRRVPSVCSLGDYESIPSGTIVQSYAYSLHRTPEIFPEPHNWKPERWLEASAEELTVMKRWFWAFGSGGRMCIGSNFAYYSKSPTYLWLCSSGVVLIHCTAMKFLIASVYANFTTTIHEHGDMDLVDAYLAGPKGRRLELKFHPVKQF